MPHEFFREILPGAVGSAGALFWLRGSWQWMLGMFLLGGASAHFLGGWLASWAGVGEGGTGFVVGMFSMAVADKIFSAIEKFDFHTIAMRFVDKLLGGKK